MHTKNKPILISGGGIAGLTLAILLKEKGWSPVIVERDSAVRTEGYVIDFAGTGWDVAERMGIVDEIKKINYPLHAFTYLDKTGVSYLSLSIEKIKKILGGKYAPLQRSDLERILYEKAKTAGVAIRFGTTIESLEDTGAEVVVTFNNGAKESFGLVFGADGVHSRVRNLVFGPEKQFDRFLGYYVAAFNLKNTRYQIPSALGIYEEPNRSMWTYSLGENRLTVMYVFHHKDIGFVPPQSRLGLLKETYRGSGWITEELLDEFQNTEPIFFDSATQIVMPSWSKGRVALLGDACACLTLLAGQGSHMAMAEAYVIAHELERYNGDYTAAFAAYEKKLKPETDKKQRDAARIAKVFVPSEHSYMPLRRFAEKIIFNNFLMGYMLKLFGVKSVLSGYR